MNTLFNIIFSESALLFLKNLERPQYEKILSNIRKVQVKPDPKFFKKLNKDIWEFRTLYNGIQYRLFAFWDKTTSNDTLVICSHGYVKKEGKIPKKEIQKALQFRNEYFNIIAK